MTDEPSRTGEPNEEDPDLDEQDLGEEGEADEAEGAPDPGSGADGDPVRIDKWLWAARFFRTRSLAGSAITGGKVQLNGERAKRSKTVRVGDLVTIRKGAYTFEVTVRALAQDRGGAPDAQLLYVESEASIEARKHIAEQFALARAAALPPVKGPAFTGKGRPTKKDRRALQRLKGDPDFS